MASLQDWKEYVEVKPGEDPSYSTGDALKIAQREGILFAYAENGAFVDLRWTEQDTSVRIHHSQVIPTIWERVLKVCPNIKALKEPQIVIVDSPDPLDPRGVPEEKEMNTIPSQMTKGGATIPPDINFSIAALRLLEEYGAEWPAGVEGTGKKGVVTKEDVEKLLGI